MSRKSTRAPRKLVLVSVKVSASSFPAYNSGPTLNTISSAVTSLIRKCRHSKGCPGSTLACARRASTRKTKLPPRQSPSSCPAASANVEAALAGAGDLSAVKSAAAHAGDGTSPPSDVSGSAEYRRRERIQAVYAELFRMHTQVRKQGEIVELVLGLGILDWRCPDKGKAGSMHRKPPLVDRLQAATQALDQCSRPSL